MIKHLFEQIDDYIDGELTLSENIADNEGLREAVVAYETWKAKHGQEPSLPGFTHLTHEQLIFLGFAHVRRFDSFCRILYRIEARFLKTIKKKYLLKRVETIYININKLFYYLFYYYYYYYYFVFFHVTRH